MTDKLLNRTVTILSALGLVAALVGCSLATSRTPELRSITVQLSWIHSAQFAGFYAADQNGDYAAEGLAVTFLEGGPTIDRQMPVLQSRAQFGLVSGAELIQARAEDKLLRAIATILRRNPFAFFALADSGITRPQDFVGRIVQIRPRARPFLRAMMARVGIAPDQYIEDNEANFVDLYSGRVDVVTGFVTAQLLEAEQAGYKLNVIYPDDYGVHFYTDVIFTTDEFMAKNPDLVKRFLRASFKGWTYAVENPAEVGQLVTRYDPEAEVALENAKMTASLPLINTGQDYIGWMRPEVWRGMVETLSQQQVLAAPVDVEQLYTLQFLQEIYDKP